MAEEQIRELERAELRACAKDAFRFLVTIAFFVTLSWLAMYAVAFFEAKQPPYIVGIAILAVSFPFMVIGLLSGEAFSFIAAWTMPSPSEAPIRVGATTFIVVALIGLWVSKRTADVVFAHLSSAASSDARFASTIELMSSKSRHYTDGFEAGLRGYEKATAARSETHSRLIWQWLFVAAGIGTAAAGLVKWWLSE